MSGQLPADPDFLPRRRVRGKGVRRLTRFPLLAGFGIAMMFVIGVVYTAYQRSHHQAGKGEGSDNLTSAASNAAGILAGAPQSGSIQAALNREAQTASPAGPPPTPGRPTSPVALAASPAASIPPGDPRAAIVQQAWIGYLHRLIQEQARREQMALAALDASVPVSLQQGEGSAPRAGRTPSGGGAQPGAPQSPPSGPPLTSGGTATGGQPIVPSITGGYLPGFGFAGAGGFTGGGTGNDPNGQAGKAAYLGNLRGNPDYQATARQNQISPDTLRAGAVIPAVMIGGVNSDLPGQIIAQVSENVYDTATGHILLIPQGARLVGTYDNGVTTGQTRVLVAWTRIIYPDGSSLDIGSMPGTDQGGYAGFHDQVNNHYFRIFGDAILMSLFSAGIQLSQPSAANNNVYSSQQIVAGALGQQLGEAGIAITQRDLGIAPTLTIRPGYRFNVMVTRDMVIRPWHG
ncbi:MAG: hypothetical protein M0Z28_15075 [Rhodospirillales bacterium]|nr:hypothetical protein [Rhodospirillales bacterium]